MIPFKSPIFDMTNYERGFYAFHLEHMNRFPGQELALIKAKWNDCSDDQKAEYNIIEETRASAEVTAFIKARAEAKSKAAAKSRAKKTR